MIPSPPFWFKQRQCKAEPAGSDNLLKVSGPNLGEVFLAIDHGEDNRWRAALRQTCDGPEVVATETRFDNPVDAWEAAFELYRTNTIC